IDDNQTTNPPTDDSQKPNVSETTKPSKANAVKTGDDVNLELAVMGLAGAALILAVTKKYCKIK
ncbi:hypothetical protein, partial [Thomasclavelia sp.]|uniref:hypothetical protein n=1 Tax=Thomasclavelia sp. TaxID=3025757 RepID=UPI0025FCF532